MSKDLETVERLTRYLDGDLTPDEVEQVEASLRKDRHMRDLLRELSLQVVVSADLLRVSDDPKSTVSLVQQRDRWNWPLVVSGALGLTLVFLVAALIGLGRDRSAPNRVDDLIRITAIGGPSEWTGDGGQISKRLTEGLQLGGGTVELLAADSWIEFAYQDGTVVAISGLAALTVAEREQKEIRLRYGRLSADVTPQPAKLPMLIRTPSAELTVIGTQFNVDAKSDQTRLAVNQGSVKLKRSSDGVQVEVPARHEVTAKLQETTSLPVQEQREAVSIWSSSLRADLIRGIWISELGTLAKELKRAVADGDMTEAEAMTRYRAAATLEVDRGSVWAEAWPYGTLVVLSVAKQDEAPVSITPRSRVRVRGVCYSEEPLHIGLTANHPGGGFAGKFEVTLDTELQGSVGQEFFVDLPIEEFHNDRSNDFTPVGLEMVDWWCFSNSTNAKIEIRSVELVESDGD